MSKILEDNKVNQIKGEKIVLIGGCFDILHQAHLEFLRRCKKLGGTLVLLLENDQNIKKLKGEGRPMNSQIARAQNLSKTGLVDYIVLLKTPEDDQYYYNLVILLHPAIIAVTENDPLLETKKRQAKMVNGKVIVVMKRDTRFSTTKLLGL